MADRIESDAPSDPKQLFWERRAQPLAEDIQANVGRALDGNDKVALEALQRDARILLSPPLDGEEKANDSRFRKAVQEKLDEFENTGTLPKITITPDGDIFVRNWVANGTQTQVDDDNGSNPSPNARGLFAGYSTSAVFEENSRPGSSDAVNKTKADRIAASNLANLADQAFCNAGFTSTLATLYGRCPPADPDTRLREIARNFARMSASEREDLQKTSSANGSFPLWKPVRDEAGKLMGFDYSKAPVGHDVRVRFGENNAVIAETTTWGDIFRIGKMHRRVTDQ